MVKGQGPRPRLLMPVFLLAATEIKRRQRTQAPGVGTLTFALNPAPKTLHMLSNDRANLNVCV